MRNEKIYENKKEDNKALKRFIPIIIISMIVGGIGGAISEIAETGLAQIISEGITSLLSVTVPYVNFVLTFVIGGIAVWLYKKARNLYREWNGEDEEHIEQIEMQLGYSMWATSILMILAFFFFAAGLSNVIISEKDNSVGIISFLMNSILFMLGFILAISFVVIIQQKIVNFEKEINPEKKGSVFDTKFSQKWVDSCDEAERFTMYQCAYKSYQATSKTCVVLLVFTIFGMMIWDIGVLPTAMVTIIWLIQTSSYCLESIRLAKKSSRNKK
ncbi:MAG: DUF3169 family protein [Lachnotalea sp.]